MYEKKGIVVSGVRPTGKLHLGHYAGVLVNWLKFQEEYECYFEVADWHAMTDRTDFSQIPMHALEMVADWLSVGIDPQRSTIFLQSAIPEHAEFHLLLSMIIPIPWVEHCPVYKDIVDKKGIEHVSYALMGYPVLQAADIMLYKADKVPVGIDQAPHVELTREIIRRFNSLFGKLFPEPETILTETPRLLGVDGKKMSKSYNNSILLTDDEGAVKHKISLLVTDPQRIRKTDFGHPKVCSAFEYYKVFNKPNVSDIEKECKNGEIGCVACKSRLGDVLIDTFKDFRKKREYFKENPKEVSRILLEGTERARIVTKRTFNEVKKLAKITY